MAKSEQDEVGKEILIESELYLSLKKAAEVSGYHSDYLGRLARGGKLKSKRLGVQWFISRPDLENFIAGRARVSHLFEKMEKKDVRAGAFRSEEPRFLEVIEIPYLPEDEEKAWQ